MRIRLLPFAILLSPLAGAADVPARKPGLWEISSEMSVMPGHKMVAQQCVDAVTDVDLLARGERERKNCGESRLSGDGSRIVVDLSCRIENSTVVTHGVFAGDFTAAYTGDVHTTYTPPLHGMQESTMRLEARWVGPCPPGQKPGDVTTSVPGLGKFNLNEMLKRRSGNP